MKAIVQDTYGSADVLELRDIDSPAIADDEVLIGVRAAVRLVVSLLKKYLPFEPFFEKSDGIFINDV